MDRFKCLIHTSPHLFTEWVELSAVRVLKGIIENFDVRLERFAYRLARVGIERGKRHINVLRVKSTGLEILC